MHPIARKEDFDDLHPEQQARMVALLTTLIHQKLACRFEMIGRDLYVTVGQGLPSPKFWADKFDINLT